jgi:hypothetical protein
MKRLAIALAAFLCASPSLAQHIDPSSGGGATSAGASGAIQTSNGAGGLSDSGLSVSNGGVEFPESDTNPACAAGNYNIYADTSEATLKKCINGVSSDLDTGGGGTLTHPQIMARTSLGF